MKVGVVCEGMTDFHAINYYVSAALQKKGLSVEFVALQPTPDNTSSGGWGNVFSWLENNPPSAREPLFGRGLFANSKKLSDLDSILIHLDTDILPDQSFLNFLRIRNFNIGISMNLNERGSELSRLISHFANLDQCAEDIAAKHIAAPIAESSEAWCIAVDPEFKGLAEELSGQALIDAFGVSLARFYKNPLKANYMAINKKTKSRERYCQETVGEVARLESCTLFVSLVEKLSAIAPQR
jgi:hypothetical protein